MRTSLTILGLATLTALVPAASVTLDNSSRSVQKPLGGTILHSITGHVRLASDEANPIFGLGEDAYLSDFSNSITPELAPEFSAYLNSASAGQSYDGPLLVIPVTSSMPDGNYAFSSSPYSPFFYFGYDKLDLMFGGVLFSDSFKVGYSLSVNPVPEPSTFAVGGLGILAFSRRRKSR